VRPLSPPLEPEDPPLEPLLDPLEELPPLAPLLASPAV
jgi:hypothetical protein